VVLILQMAREIKLGHHLEHKIVQLNPNVPRRPPIACGRRLLRRRGEGHPPP
jgi:hypothetical protein